jgi:hypothetical protein
MSMNTIIPTPLWMWLLALVLVGMTGFALGRMYRSGWGMACLQVVLYPLRPILRPILNCLAKRMQPEWDAKAKAERQELIKKLQSRGE